jgi:hypothetical protein
MQWNKDRRKKQGERKEGLARRKKGRDRWKDEKRRSGCVGCVRFLFKSNEPNTAHVQLLC